jgi:hypothetical protein
MRRGQRSHAVPQSVEGESSPTSSRLSPQRQSAVQRIFDTSTVMGKSKFDFKLSYR